MTQSCAASPSITRDRTLALRGFTLLELLVVMSLLSVIMVGLVSALRSMSQTETKIDQRLERLDEIRVARAFLQQTVGRLSAQTVDDPKAPGKKKIAFEATPDSVSWVGIMPARADLGGRHFFRLAMENTGTGRELVIRFAPWEPDQGFPDWNTAQERVLISGIATLAVQAQGIEPAGQSSTSAWPTGWQTGWPVPDVLPEQLRLSLVDAQGQWPKWDIALLALPQSEGNYSVTVIGGGVVR